MTYEVDKLNTEILAEFCIDSDYGSFERCYIVETEGNARFLRKYFVELYGEVEGFVNNSPYDCTGETAETYREFKKLEYGRYMVTRRFSVDC